MAKKPMIGLLAVILFVLVWLASCSPFDSTLPSKPHLNPENLRHVYSDVDLMRYIVGVLDFVIAEKPQELESLKDKLRFAAIRPEALETAWRFLSSAHSLSENMVVSEADLEAIMLLAKQNRLDEAKELMLDIVKKKLSPALSDLSEMNRSVTTIGRVVNIDKSPEGSEIRISYEQAIQMLAKIEQNIRFLNQFSQDGDIIALLKNLQIQIDPKKYPALQIQIDFKKYSVLQPADLSLEILPQRAYVGDTVSFSGKLTSRGVAIPGRDVHLELDGKNHIVVKADSVGYYNGDFKLPYMYSDMVTIRARYLPVGVDTDIYLAAVSPSVKVETLFYIARLRIGVPPKGYPGLSMAIKGEFGYADPPLPGTRKVEILVDGLPYGSVMADKDFGIEVALERNLSLGRRQVSVVAPGQGRYGPSLAEATVNIVKATPVVDFRTPGLALIPWGLEARGKVESEIAPLNSAQIRLRFGQKVIETATDIDGTFQHRFGLSFFSALIGRQGLGIEVIPAEPWNDSISTRQNIWVFNPLVLASILFIVTILYYGVKVRIKAKGLWPSAVTDQPILAPDSVSGSSSATVNQEPNWALISMQSAEDKILQIYQAAVRFIVGTLGIGIRPHLTLRELAKEVSPRLGAASTYVWQLTLIVEKVLYSKHPPVEKDRQDVENLASKIRKGIKQGPPQ